MYLVICKQPVCAGPAGQRELYFTAEALSEAALLAPANYATLSSAYVQAALGQLTINTPASIQVATAALAALRSAQQPLMVQVRQGRLLPSR